jgi:hypothetical protein
LFFARIFTPDEEAQLGGTWLSFITINLGAVFVWASIFIEPMRVTLSGIGYLLWAISILPIAATLWHTVQKGLTRFESQISLQK